MAPIKELGQGGEERKDGVYVEISMNPNHQYRLWTFVFLIYLTEQSVHHHHQNLTSLKKTLTSKLDPA